MRSASDRNSMLRTKRLKKLINEGLELQKVVNVQSQKTILDEVNRMVDASNEIITEGDPHDRAEHTSEVILDCKFLKINSSVVSALIKNVSSFDDVQYKNAITKLVSTDEGYDWNKLAEIACSIAHTVRSSPSMFGSVDLEIKEHVAKERKKMQRRTQVAEETRPESVDRVKRQDKGADKVNILHRKLSNLFRIQNRKPIPFYKLIIVPDNFMATVENAFQIAFLARDNLVAIERGEDGYPTVRVLNLEETKEKEDSSQSICSLDENFVKRMQEHYQVRQPMINMDDSSDEDN